MTGETVDQLRGSTVAAAREFQNRLDTAQDDLGAIGANRLRDGDTVLATAENPGSLSPGDTLTVDLTRTFRVAGEKDLAVVAVGTDDDGEEVTVRRPVSVYVEGAAPLVEFERTDPVAGVETTLPVTVSNPNTEQYRDVVVTLDAPGAVVERRTVATLPGGASTTLNVSYVPPAGDVTVGVDVSYVTNTGAERTTRYEESVEVAPLRSDVGVAVEPVDDEPAADPTGGALSGVLGGGTGGGPLQSQGEEDASGPPDALAVEVTNFGNAPLTDAVVVPRADGERLDRVAVGTVQPGESTTVEVSLASLDAPATVTATVEYATGDRTGSAAGSYEYRPPAGDLQLTGVDLTLEDGTLTITGNAGNVGDGEVTGVVDSVGEAGGVRPAYPSRDYFVGTVEASEFAPFELTAAVDAENATTVPIEVTYRVAGEERTRTETLPLDGVEAEGTDRRSAGANPGVAVALVAGFAVVAGAVVFGVRRTRSR
jgi:predicted secreted protein